MKLVCMVSNIGWFTEGNVYGVTEDADGFESITDDDGDEWFVRKLSRTFWELYGGEEYADFQEVEE